MPQITPADEKTRRAWTFREFCRNYRIGKDTGYQAIRDGTLIARKVGNRTIVTIEDAEKFIATLPQLKLPKKLPRSRKPRASKVGADESAPSA